MHRTPLLRVVLVLLACLLFVAVRATAGSSVDVDADGSTLEENKKGHRLPNGQPVSAVAEVLYDEGVALLEDKDEAGAAAKFLAAMQEEPMYMQVNQKGWLACSTPLRNTNTTTRHTGHCSIWQGGASNQACDCRKDAAESSGD